MRRTAGILLVVAALGCTTRTGPPDAEPFEYETVAHPVSGVELPRVRLPERPEIEREVNAALDELAADLRCFDDVEDGWYDVHSSVEYAAHEVFSVAIASNFFCGGAHPMNDADTSVTYDLRTGEAVPFRSLFTDYERDGAEIRQVYLRKLSAEEREGCEDVLTEETLAELFVSFAYTVSPEGLRMKTSFPHVLEACNRTSVIAFGELRAFAPPGGILGRLADAADRGPGPVGRR